MAKSLSARDNFNKILLGTFGIAFALILGVLLYATSTNTDLRSKAALEEKVYKDWQFEDRELEGWDINPKSGSSVGVGDGVVEFTVDSASVVLTHKKVNVKMDKGQKMIRLAAKTNVGSWIPEAPGMKGTAGGMMPYRPDDTAALRLDGKVEYKVSGKQGWQKGVLLGGVFNGEKGIFTANFPQINAITIEELKVTLTSARPLSVTLDNIVLVSPATQVKPIPTPGLGPITPLPTTKSGGRGFACIQVITPARNEQTGACQTFSTPCDVPTGWVADSSCSTGSWVRE